MSKARKQFDQAILVIDILRDLSKHLSLILGALAALTFYFAGSAFAEGNFGLGIVDVGLGVANVILLIQLRRRIAKSRNRLTSFPGAHNDCHIQKGERRLSKDRAIATIHLQEI
jgi:hypothetical protein